MFSDRSWASSKMIVSYWFRYGSPWVSAKRMPSVMSLMYVCGERASAKRTLKPTSRPSGEASSSAIRAATLRAAMRRGWVWPIRPSTPRPNSKQIFGNWVDLPEPVSPQTTTAWWSRMAQADFITFGRDRQIVVVVKWRHAAAALLAQGHRPPHRLDQLHQTAVGRLVVVPQLSELAQLAAKAVAVAAHGTVDLTFELEPIWHCRGHLVTSLVPLSACSRSSDEILRYVRNDRRFRIRRGAKMSSVLVLYWQPQT